MRSILFCNFDRSLGPETIDFTRTEAKRDSLFTKYFPKYIKTMIFSFGNIKKSSARSKVKRAKIIQEVKGKVKFFTRKDWRVLLGDKVKTLKSFSNYAGFPFKTPEHLHLLSGLKNLSLHAPLESVPEGLFSKWKVKPKKLLKNINCLQNLQSLSILNLPKEDKFVIEKLNSSTRLLSSLTKFKIGCSPNKPWESELLQILQSKKNILKYVTSLDLKSLETSAHFASFKNFSGSCPKLETLSFSFSIVKEPTDDMDYLGTLKTFQNLKSLKLRVEDVLTFLKYLVLPPSIQHLVLNFKQCLTKEIMQEIFGEFSHPENEEELSKRFEENPIFIRFYDSFRNLEGLESLDISFNEDSSQEAYQYQSHLANSLLKRVPSLQKFTCGLVQYNFTAKKIGPTFYTDDSSLPQLFESFSHSSKTLKTLEIGHGKIKFTNLDLPASRGKFPELSTIKLTGKFDDENLGRLSELENLVLLGDSLTKIQLLIHMNHNVKSLISLLENLSKVKMSEKLHFEIEVLILDGKSLENLSETEFERLTQWLKENQSLKARKTSLKMKTNIGSDQMKKFLDVFGERFEKFELVKISVSSRFGSYIFGGPK